MENKKQFKKILTPERIREIETRQSRPIIGLGNEKPSNTPLTTVEIRTIETLYPEELAKATDRFDEEDLQEVLFEVMEKLAYHPDQYYIQAVRNKEGAYSISVKKKSDNSIIYYTKDMKEIRQIISSVTKVV